MDEAMKNRNLGEAYDKFKSLLGNMTQVDAIEPNQPSQAGTWQFMSIRRLVQPDRRPTLQDDLESFFWMILHSTLQFCVTNLSLSKPPRCIPCVVKAIFGPVDITSDDEEVQPGTAKIGVACEGRYIGGNTFEVVGNQPLTGFIAEIRQMVKQNYLHWFLHDRFMDIFVEEQDMTLDGAVQRYEEMEKQLKLNSHTAMMESFIKALNSTEWPTGDAPSDQLLQCNCR